MKRLPCWLMRVVGHVEVVSPAGRWLQIRLELIGISVMLSIALVVVLLRWPADPGTAICHTVVPQCAVCLPRWHFDRSLSQFAVSEQHVGCKQPQKVWTHRHVNCCTCILASVNYTEVIAVQRCVQSHSDGDRPTHIGAQYDEDLAQGWRVWP